MTKTLNRDLLEDLYRRHEQAMYNVAYRWVWNEAEAQDIVQEAFLRLWRRRTLVRADGAEAYAYRIVLNLSASRRRRQRLWQWLPLTDEAERFRDDIDIAQRLDRDKEGLRMKKALDRLPGKLKQALMLCEFSGYSYEEVGRILGIPAGTVGSRRNKALKLLNESLSRPRWIEMAGQHERSL